MRKKKQLVRELAPTHCAITNKGTYVDYGVDDPDDIYTGTWEWINSNTIKVASGTLKRWESGPGRTNDYQSESELQLEYEEEVEVEVEVFVMTRTR
ncbi:MAG: hypothetical protein LBS05_02855 [Tannerellaceae bacterium]|jgi:hypothetical protein|nr:hypothetical protein [Tannerellaceae bacterium]